MARLPIVSNTSWWNVGGRFARQVAEGLFAVLFPSDCRICGTPLTNISRLPVCPECIQAMPPLSGGLCAVCGERLFTPYAVEGLAGACGLCQRAAPPFVRAIAYGSYEGGLRELIHLLKFGGVRPAAGILGRMLAEAISGLEAGLPEAVIVIPVPLFRAKLRQRGFNQAELIVRAALKLNADGRFALLPGALARTRETTSQIGLTRNQRRENLRGAFKVARPEAIRGRDLLLVDDVLTTGATVSECARVLHRAGASKVWVATVARTLKASARQVEIELDRESVAQDEDDVSIPKAVGI